VNAAERWLGAGIDELHPLLRRLHRDGGRLRGPIDVRFGRGLAGLLGRRLARRLGMPGAGGNVMEVDIRSDADGLRWHRRFNGATEFRSLFAPHARYPDGHWTESSGRIRLKLAVRIIDGGWHWQQLGASLHGMPLPAWLFAGTRAGKDIVDGRYRFAVELLLAYGGVLEPVDV